MTAAGAAALSPVPFFRQVERVGLLCSVTAEPARAGLLEEGALCAAAAAELTGLIGAGGPPVAVLVRNDERIADPATLLVLLQASLRAPEPAEAGGANATLLALSAGLQRARADVGGPPFFAAVPQALVAPGGAPEAAATRAALRRLLSGIARPLLANR